MEVSRLREVLKGMKSSDEVIFWEWDGNNGTSRFFDLETTLDPKRFKGFLMLMVNGYGPTWECKDRKLVRRK